MMRCLPAPCPVSTHLTKRSWVARSSQTSQTTMMMIRRRGMAVVVRADSTSTSTSEATPAAAASVADDFALSSPPADPKSIITPENILAALSGEGIILEDHYGRLGISPESSSEEIATAYKDRRADVQAQSLGEAEAQAQLNKLKPKSPKWGHTPRVVFLEAVNLRGLMDPELPGFVNFLGLVLREVNKDSLDLLLSEEERRMYDWSLLRKATHTVEYAWPYEADVTQILADKTPLPGPPADPEGTRNWTLFFVGMFVLSIALNFFIGFNP